MKRIIALVLSILLLAALLAGCKRSEISAPAAPPTAAPDIASLSLPVRFAMEYLDAASSIQYESGDSRTFAIVTLENPGEYGVSSPDGATLQLADGSSCSVVTASQSADGVITWCMSVPLEQQENVRYLVIGSQAFPLTEAGDMPALEVAAETAEPTAPDAEETVKPAGPVAADTLAILFSRTYDEYTANDGHQFAIISVEDPAAYGVTSIADCELLLSDGTRLTPPITSRTNAPDGALVSFKLVFVVADDQQALVKQASIDAKLFDLTIE